MACRIFAFFGYQDSDKETPLLIAPQADFQEFSLCLPDLRHLQPPP